MLQDGAHAGDPSAGDQFSCELFLAICKGDGSLDRHLGLIPLSSTAGKATEEPPMSLDGQYDANNIFAKIVRGEIPSANVWEDDQTLVFMDAFPQSKGHTLVISKTAQARNL